MTIIIRVSELLISNVKNLKNVCTTCVVMLLLHLNIRDRYNTEATFEKHKFAHFYYFIAWQTIFSSMKMKKSWFWIWLTVFINFVNQVLQF